MTAENNPMHAEVTDPDNRCLRCGQYGHTSDECKRELPPVDLPVRPGRVGLDSLPLRRGVATTDDLRRRSWIDPHDRNPYSPCWHWRGAMSGSEPRIWAFCHAVGDKRVMTGSEAAFNIARGMSPKPGIAYRHCFCNDCVNPEHLRWAKDRAEMGVAMREAGVRKGTHVAQRRANVLKAQIAAGCAPAPAEIVRAVRAAPSFVSGRELAALFGISQQSVSRMRRGESHRNVTTEAA